MTPASVAHWYWLHSRDSAHQPTKTSAEIGSRPCHSIIARCATNDSAASTARAARAPMRPGQPMTARIACVENPTPTAARASAELNRADPRNSVTAGGTRVLRASAMQRILRRGALGLDGEDDEERPS